MDKLKLDVQNSILYYKTCLFNGPFGWRIVHCSGADGLISFSIADLFQLAQYVGSNAIATEWLLYNHSLIDFTQTYTLRLRGNEKTNKFHSKRRRANFII
ncbi:hypothetical protein KAR48_12690 [bacterium]|nr:hypothetical protein [bacterium]